MNYQLTGITKRSKFIYYHICYIYADGRTKYLEMRHERTDKDKLYLKCCRRSKCNATISILIKDAIGTEKSSSGPRYVLKPDVTDEILMNKENYDTVFHRHSHRCVQTVDSDGQCRSTKHEPECYKNVDQQNNWHLAA